MKKRFDWETILAFLLAFLLGVGLSALRPDWPKVGLPLDIEGGGTDPMWSAPIGDGKEQMSDKTEIHNNMIIGAESAGAIYVSEDVVISNNVLIPNPAAPPDIPPGTEHGGAVWVVDEWASYEIVPGRREQGRAHWQCPEGHEVSFPDGEFRRPLCVPLK